MEAVAEGERRALRQWQAEHREPCDECGWETVNSWDGRSVAELLNPCPKHGGKD